MYTKTLLLSLFLSPVFLFSQAEPLLGHPLLPSDTGFVFKVTEQMPLFPGCDNTLEYMKLKQCSDKKMLEFIYGTLRYPEDAIEDGIEGMAVVSFIVEKDGRMTSINATRTVCPSITEESLYIIDVMAMDLPPWRPGMQGGKPVRVHVNLPIKFRLPRD
ncbi:energy transducer TonB [Neolewinella persica]|uniref:energy transducer TonB n=1 Tax=Neolewinella persica TaxID=70998 RepID=UPI0003744773|nr:energy transducer TonB [Neolewinella persica]